MLVTFRLRNFLQPLYVIVAFSMSRTTWAFPFLVLAGLTLQHWGPPSITPSTHYFLCLIVFFLHIEGLFLFVLSLLYLKRIIKLFRWPPKILHIILGEKKSGYFLKWLSQASMVHYTSIFPLPHASIIQVFSIYLLRAHCAISILLEAGDKTGNGTYRVSVFLGHFTMLNLTKQRYWLLLGY